MASEKPEVAQAYWLGPRAGCVLLSRNWEEARPPTLALDSGPLRLGQVRPARPDFIGRFCGYYGRDDGCVVFCQEAERHPQIDFAKNPVQVAGPFNHWGAEGPAEQWRLRPRPLPGGGVLWECAVPWDRLRPGPDGVGFKFVSADWHWLIVLLYAPNAVYDKDGNANYRLEPQRSGRHAFLFEVEGGRGLDGRHRIGLDEPGSRKRPLITPGLTFFDLATDRPLGARLEAGGSGIPPRGAKAEATVFRLFAPRATSVAVEVFADPAAPRSQTHAMRLLEDELTWEARVPGNLHGWFYYLRVDGGRRLLDPWALATVGPAGPGIVIDRDALPRRPAEGGFKPPFWHDLIVLEGHLRDLLARAPLALTAGERLGFRGLTKWIAQDGSYLRDLGVNALELLPVAQSATPKRADYDWGYMPVNFFSPSAHYAGEPGRASQIEELRDLVAECHRRGLAVILDVVYNHVGEPAALRFIDKLYYFQVADGGGLANWSGCGNTLRAGSAMAKRLIIDSLVHLVETFDIDGFRFDLAELLTVEVLREVELALKAIKPSIILIAEPWSFRGSIAWRLRAIGCSFWNDGFRDFVAHYVRGRGDAEGLRYFMKGSLDHLSAWPAQSVNYVESHDDRCWLDKITENPRHDGRNPTPDDIHRTHLALAILLCSIGIPMLAAGQDFLRSKHGLNNTYRNGDVNALDYARLQRFGLTHFYCKQWIAFRRSTWGELLRLWDRPAPGYVRLFARDGGSAAAVLFNADHSRGARQMLFAVNPQAVAVELAVDGIRADGWQELADRGNFNFHGIFNGRLAANERRLRLGPVDCGLWVRHG
jgi:pullulanase/glycogen debranching enzyme